MEASHLAQVVGLVEVEGQSYQLKGPADHVYQAIRVADSSPVGSFKVTAGEIWKMESDAPELMHAIVEEAMSAGLLEPPPSD
jgi:hypothetical protein